MVNLQIRHRALRVFQISQKDLPGLFLRCNMQLPLSQLPSELLEFTIVPDRLDNPAHQCLYPGHHAFRRIVDLFDPSFLRSRIPDIPALDISHKSSSKQDRILEDLHSVCTGKYDLLCTVL